MFKKKKKGISYFSTELKIEGKIKFSETTLRIDGIFEGEIESTESGVLIVGKNAVVTGKVSVDQLLVEGKIIGDIFASERAVILSSAEIVGSLVTPIVRVEEGAKIEGSINSITKSENVSDSAGGLSILNSYR